MGRVFFQRSAWSGRKGSVRGQQQCTKGKVEKGKGNAGDEVDEGG